MRDIKLLVTATSRIDGINLDPALKDIHPEDTIEYVYPDSMVF